MAPSPLPTFGENIKIDKLSRYQSPDVRLNAYKLSNYMSKNVVEQEVKTGHDLPHGNFRSLKSLEEPHSREGSLHEQRSSQESKEGGGGYGQDQSSTDRSQHQTRTLTEEELFKRAQDREIQELFEKQMQELEQKTKIRSSFEENVKAHFQYYNPGKDGKLPGFERKPTEIATSLLEIGADWRPYYEKIKKRKLTVVDYSANRVVPLTKGFKSQNAQNVFEKDPLRKMGPAILYSRANMDKF